MIDQAGRPLLVHNCFTFDPRRKSKVVPFLTWPIQDETILGVVDAIAEGQKLEPEYKDLLIEKSRDMGASWIFCIVMEHHWHFHRGHSYLMISRKQELVDDPGNPDALFWKIDFIHRNLPPWMIPQMKRTEMHFANLETGSTIDGEATTGASGVGGRRTAVLTDEFSRIQQGHMLIAGLADTTNMRLWNFTPFGTNNAAYHLSQRKDVKKLRMMWWDDPRKNQGLYTGADGKKRSPWYDKEERQRSKQEMAMMIDANYAGAAFQYFDEDTLTKLKEEYALPPLHEGDIEIDPTDGKPRFIAKKGGPLKLWCNLDTNGRPPLDRQYVCGSDISQGMGASNSCDAFIDCKTGEKIAEYVSAHIPPHPFAEKTFLLLKWFTGRDEIGPKVIWEHFGPGVQFGARLIELGYREVYYRRSEDVLGKPLSGDKLTPGWSPNPSNKGKVLGNYREAILDGKVTERSGDCLDECRNYQFAGDSFVYAAGELDAADPSGAKANHGDRVMASAMACKLYREDHGGEPEAKRIDVFMPNTLASRHRAMEKKKGFWE